jgi:hypothetical protein
MFPPNPSRSSAPKRSPLSALGDVLVGTCGRSLGGRFASYPDHGEGEDDRAHGREHQFGFGRGIRGEKKRRSGQDHDRGYAQRDADRSW